MELRDIEIFLTLAHELHFGRTAARLHVSQARVSQAIKLQERRIGGPLFDRSTRIVKLTPLGEQLRADLEPLFLGLHDSLRRAREAALSRDRTLTIGVVSTNASDMRPLWDLFRARHPEWELRIRHAPFLDWFQQLRAKHVDAVVTWLPVEEPDFTVGPVLFAERRMLIVPTEHQLALRSSVDVEILGDFGFLGLGAPVPEYWDDAYLPFQTPRGRPVERVRPVESLEQILSDVANGETVHVLGAHNARFNVRPDITFVPIDGAAPLRWGLVWSSASESAPLRAFAALARETGPLPLRLE